MVERCPNADTALDLGSAVVNGVLYTIGGYTSLSTASNAVEAYDPARNSWTQEATMPITNGPVAAAVGTSIYAIGGYSATSGQRLADVYAYDTKTNAWQTRQPMKAARSNPAVGTIGKSIVVAGGVVVSGYTSDNEAYAAKKNRWKAKAPDPTAMAAPCSAAVGKTLYVAGGEGSSGPISVLDAYTLKTNRWAAKASMPQAVIGPASATVGGLLYCFGGANAGYPNGSTTFYNKVQVYQP